MADERNVGGKHVANKNLRSGTAPRRPARAAQRKESGANAVDRKALYDHFVPYIQHVHERNVRSLKGGVWLLVLLPFILAAIRYLTDANRIAFLIIWIIGMFAIAVVLIFTAYSDHDLKRTLRVLQEVVPPEEEIEIPNLLPVDAEGEGWLIDPEDLPIPLPTIDPEKLPLRRGRHEAQPAEEETGESAEAEAEVETERSNGKNTGKNTGKNSGKYTGRHMQLDDEFLTGLEKKNAKHLENH